MRLLLDNFKNILEIAIDKHEEGEVNRDIYLDALTVWEMFFLFNDAVTRGCDDNDPASVEAHAQELERLGSEFIAAYLEVAIDTDVTVYMHIMSCHMGDLVRKWGGLMKWCSQGAEAMHQMTKFFARKRSARKGNVSGVVMSRLHMLLKYRGKPSRRQHGRRKGRPVTGTGHVSKAKREGHVQAQASLQHKYPSHQFNQSRALKRAKME